MGHQPCRILWRGFTLQMMRKTPLRRIILQFSQRLRIEGVTFIFKLLGTCYEIKASPASVRNELPQRISRQPEYSHSLADI